MISRLRLATVSIALLSIAAASAAPPPKPKAPASGPQDPLEAQRSLYVEIPEVKLDALPLDEFGTWLARETKVNVVIRWPQLEREGITQETPVTLTMKQPLLVEVLNAVLNQLAEGKVALGFRANDNIIIISTRADLDRAMVTKTYDVEDLLLEVPNFEAVRPANLDRVIQAPKTAAKPQKSSGADDAAQNLIDVITSSVFPNSWKVNGGSGTIKFFRGKLIIRNTPEVHNLLRGTLRVKDSGPQRR